MLFPDRDGEGQPGEVDRQRPRSGEEYRSRTDRGSHHSGLDLANGTNSKII